MFSLFCRLSTWRSPHLLPSASACSTAPAARPQLLISAARGAFSSKPTASRCCCQSTGQTDGRTSPPYAVTRPSQYYHRTGAWIAVSMRWLWYSFSETSRDRKWPCRIRRRRYRCRRRPLLCACSLGHRIWCQHRTTSNLWRKYILIKTQIS